MVNNPNETGSASSDTLYLKKLTFSSELKKTWLNFFVTNFRVVLLIIALITVWGGYSYTMLPRESNPEVKIPIAIVATTYPGASPSDIEELVTKKIETGISGLEGIKKITSNSSNSSSVITVEFEANEDLDDSIRRVRDEVATLKSELPDDANDPLVKEVSMDNRPIWTIGITGGQDNFILRKFAEDIQEELEKISGVREVNVSGGDEEEFEIAYDPKKLLFYGLSADGANQVVKMTNRVFPSGTFEGENYVYSVRTDSRFYDAGSLESIPLAHTQQNAPVFLRDIASVRVKAIKKTAYSRFSIEGTPSRDAVTIDIIKKTGSSILDVVDTAKKTVDRMMRQAPEGVSYDITVDFAKEIKEEFQQLVHDFLLTLILVFSVLFFIVGLKEALVAGLAIPLVFFVSFGIMQATGITLNFLSIFSLLLSLGLLVDDAIVVVSATKQYLRTGKFTPEEAVLLVLHDFKVVLTTTTLTTVWAFLPLLMATGIIGSFIKSIPITVSVTIISSLLIALMVNHPLAAVMERIRFTRKWFYFYITLFSGIALFLFFTQKTFVAILFGAFLLLLSGWMIRWRRKKGKAILEENEKKAEAEWRDDELIKKKLAEQGKLKSETLSDRLLHGIIPFWKILPVYERYLKKALKNRKSRWGVLGVTALIFLFAVSLPVTGIVKSEFFPASDEDNIYLDLEAPIGLKLDETNRIALGVEEQLLGYPDIANFTTIVGREGASPNRVSVISKNSSNLASIVITLKDKKERQMTSYDLAATMRRDMAAVGKEAKLTIASAKGGPPSGAAFEARISGDDLQTLDKIAQDLEPVLNSIPGVVDSEISLKNAPVEYTFSLDPVKLEQNDLNASGVGALLRLAISGTEITTVIRDNKETGVVARFDEEKIPDLASIQNLQIINSKKQPVYLKDVATVELRPSVDSITRINQKRVVLLSAGVEGKTSSNAVVAEFQKKIKKYPLPQGYEIIYGGENETNAESVLSILRAMIFAAFLIISTLIIQFNSFKKAIIVLVTFPLALIGVFVGMALFRITLSFPGLIGILALFGIVVKNAIILIDKINLNLKNDISFLEAVIDAGKSRLEAIFITSICTIFGIIPVTLSNETWKALGGSIIFGLSLSSFLTLFIVPVLFVTLVSPRERID
ncbi:efflux RND transporter permease subunit [Candidatus Peregrinibacteria bacterium]|nr:efflux RND transporter permease subunit [Candidatus Peregrinibacteria bacterium]